MPLPIARVLQEFQTAAATVTDPVLRTVVVGPNVHSKSYPTDRATILATERVGSSVEALMTTTGSDPTIAATTITNYPGNLTGAIPIDASVKAYVEGWVSVANATDCVGTRNGDTLTTTAGDFSSLAAGDRIIIQTAAVQVFEDLNQDFSPAGLNIVAGTDILKIGNDEHNIAAVLSKHRMLVEKVVSGNADKGLFDAADGTANVSYVLGDNATAFDNKLNNGTTGQRIAWREVRVFRDTNTDFTAKGVKAGQFLKIGSNNHSNF